MHFHEMYNVDECYEGRHGTVEGNNYLVLMAFKFFTSCSASLTIDCSSGFFDVLLVSISGCINSASFLSSFSVLLLYSILF